MKILAVCIAFVLISTKFPSMKNESRIRGQLKKKDIKSAVAIGAKHYETCLTSRQGKSGSFHSICNSEVKTGFGKKFPADSGKFF